MLGDERLESPGGYADMNMGRPSGVGLRNIAFEPVCSGSVGDHGRPVHIVILSVRPRKPELDHRMGKRRAVA